jgi:hypothetical protein
MYRPVPFLFTRLLIVGIDVFACYACMGCHCCTSFLSYIQPHYFGHFCNMETVVLLCSLNTLFNGLEESSQLRYIVYTAIIKLASQSDLLHLASPKLEEINVWLAKWDVGLTKRQVLLRLLYDAFIQNKQRYCMAIVAICSMLNRNSYVYSRDKYKGMIVLNYISVLKVTLFHQLLIPPCLQYQWFCKTRVD